MAAKNSDGKTQPNSFTLHDLGLNIPTIEPVRTDIKKGTQTYVIDGTTVKANYVSHKKTVCIEGKCEFTNSNGKAFIKYEKGNRKYIEGKMNDSSYKIKFDKRGNI